MSKNALNISFKSKAIRKSSSIRRLRFVSRQKTSSIKVWIHLPLQAQCKISRSESRQKKFFINVDRPNTRLNKTFRTSTKQL